MEKKDQERIGDASFPSELQKKLIKLVQERFANNFVWQFYKWNVGLLVVFTAGNKGAKKMGFDLPFGEFDKSVLTIWSYKSKSLSNANT